MLRAIAMASISLLLAGCATDSVLRVSERAPVAMRVTWVRGSREEVAHHCRAASRRLQALSGQEAVACTKANPASGQCTIYSTHEVLLSTLGDELAHCYLGAWHY